MPFQIYLYIQCIIVNNIYFYLLTVHHVAFLSLRERERENGRMFVDLTVVAVCVATWSGKEVLIQSLGQFNSYSHDAVGHTKPQH